MTASPPSDGRGVPVVARAHGAVGAGGPDVGPDDIVARFAGYDEV